MLRSPNITNEMRTQLDAIARQINKLMEIIETIYGLMANTRSQAIHKKLNKLVDESKYPGFKNLTLSQKAILLLNSVEEISCTLIGMRQKKYVDDIIGSLKMPPIAGAKEILREVEM
jgi:hypothetical protein